MNKNSKSMPPFKNVADEAHFWDTHDAIDLSEIPDTELHPVVLVEKQARLTNAVTVRYEPYQLLELKKEARQKGVGVTTLIRMISLEHLATR